MSKSNRVNVWWKAAAAICAVILLMIVGNSCVWAQSVGVVTGLKQTDAGTNSFQIAWNGVPGAKGYEIVVKDMAGNEAEYRTFLGSSYSISQNISPASHYIVSVRPTGGQEWAMVEVVTKPKYSVGAGNLMQELSGNTTTDISIGWEPCEGADGYCVEYWEKGSPDAYAAKLDIVGDTVCRLTGLSKDTEYHARIRPYCMSKEGYRAIGTDGSGYAYNDELSVIPDRISGVKMGDFLIYAGQAKFVWNGSGCADGYQWQLYSGDKKIDGGTTTYKYAYSAKAKANRFYKVRVRGYLVLGGEKVYGAWSGWQYVSSQPKTVNYEQKTGKLSLSWSKVNGATGYTIYVSTKKPSGTGDMKKIKTTSKTSYTVRKYNGSEISKNQRYYVVIVANKKVGDRNYQSLEKEMHFTLSK